MVISAENVTPLISTYARIGLGLIAVLRADVEASREQYENLSSVAVTYFVGISGDPVLGLLAHTVGDLNQAVAHLEDDTAVYRKAGYRPELAWNCCDYAGALVERNKAGDHDKAIVLLDGSLSIASERAMRPLME